jgi:FKBP-type peptidyl-prolyl cis-trans isomerase
MKKGIKIISDIKGNGRIPQKGEEVIIEYDLYLNKGNLIQKNQKIQFTLGDRNNIAGLNYGLENMKAGGDRKFKASPHLCYGEEGVDNLIPPNAVLIFHIRLLKIMKRK